jgi:hypothetical protein
MGVRESLALYNFIVMIQGSIVELFCIYKREGGDGREVVADMIN